MDLHSRHLLPWAYPFINGCVIDVIFLCHCSHPGDELLLWMRFYCLWHSDLYSTLMNNINTTDPLLVENLLKHDFALFTISWWPICMGHITVLYYDRNSGSIRWRYKNFNACQTQETSIIGIDGITGPWYVDTYRRKPYGVEEPIRKKKTSENGGF